MSVPVCAKCSKSLEYEIEPGDEHDASQDDSDVHMSGASSTPQTVPDDVHLSCGDHFHWECLLEGYELDKCPHCSRDITAHPGGGGGGGGGGGSSTTDSSQTVAAPQILVDLNNEGGHQRQIDIFPLLQEESYLRAYPEETKCRAFLEFCREGDHRAIADLLKSCNDHDAEDAENNGEEIGPEKTADEVLRYQDPIGNMQSGLHAAAANGHREVAWLLLLLASSYPELEMPPLVFQEAAALGVMRSDDQIDKIDIRSLTDAHGRNAEDVARQAGVVWNGWIGNGRLAMP